MSSGVCLWRSRQTCQECGKVGHIRREPSSMRLAGSNSAIMTKRNHPRVSTSSLEPRSVCEQSRACSQRRFPRRSWAGQTCRSARSCPATCRPEPCVRQRIHHFPDARREAQSRADSSSWFMAVIAARRHPGNYRSQIFNFQFSILLPQNPAPSQDRAICRYRLLAERNEVAREKMQKTVGWCRIVENLTDIAETSSAPTAAALLQACDLSGFGQDPPACRKHPVRGNGPSPTGLLTNNSEPDFLARSWRTNGRNEEGRLWLRFHGDCLISPILMFRNGKRARC